MKIKSGKNISIIKPIRKLTNNAIESEIRCKHCYRKATKVASKERYLNKTTDEDCIIFHLKCTSCNRYSNIMASETSLYVDNDNLYPDDDIFHITVPTS